MSSETLLESLEGPGRGSREMEDGKVKVEWSLGESRDSRGRRECGNWNWQGIKAKLITEQGMKVASGIRVHPDQVTRPA